MIVVLNGLRYPQLDKMSPAAQDWHGVQMRGDEAARVMGLAFTEFRHFPLFKAGDQVGSAEVWQGSRDTVPLVTAQPDRRHHAGGFACGDESRSDLCRSGAGADRQGPADRHAR